MRRKNLYFISLYFGLFLGGITFGIFNDELLRMFDVVVGYTPKPSFLSDIAAFEAVVIAIAIPLSFEIISRTSDRYNSDIIISNFLRKWEVNSFPIIIIILVIITILSRFLVNDAPISLVWKIFAWIGLMGFIFVAVFFLRFISTFKRYLTNIESVLDELFSEAEKVLE
jgi:hypothetical protein